MSSQVETKCGLYKVQFKLNGIEQTIELVLNVKENKNNVKNMIAVMINKTSKHIKKIRLTFRKYLRGVTSIF